MRVLWRLGFLAITLALLPAPAPAQSLGEAAAREKERRDKEGKKPPAKVFTDNDLGGRAGSGTVSQPGSSGGSTSPETTGASPAPSAEGKGETKLEPTEEELRAQKETVWRKKREVVQDEINRLAEAVDKLQSLVNDMTGTLYGPGRAGLIAQLETGKKSLAEARQMLADLDEEGRQNRYR
jgi:hypothetical protein